MFLIREQTIFSKCLDGQGLEGDLFHFKGFVDVLFSLKYILCEKLWQQIFYHLPIFPLIKLKQLFLCQFYQLFYNIDESPTKLGFLLAKQSIILSILEIVCK